MERLCRDPPAMACSEHGDAAGVFLHSCECRMFGNLHAGPDWTGRFIIPLHRSGLGD